MAKILLLMMGLYCNLYEDKVAKIAIPKLLNYIELCKDIEFIRDSFKMSLNKTFNVLLKNERSLCE